MAERQFEMSKRAFIRKCSAAILLGSLIPVWVFIIWEYFSSAPVLVLETQLLCIPIFGYQLPAYMVSGMIGISLIKRGWIKSALAAYMGVGISGWIVSSLFFFIMFTNEGEPAIQAMEIAFMVGLPSLLLYLVFLYPRPADREQ